MTVHKPLITFQRVPVRPRRDVWTAERQVAFIRKLANCGGVPPRPHLAMGREPAARNRLPRASARGTVNFVNFRPRQGGLRGH